MLVEAIAAGIVGAALLWLVFQPILLPSLVAPEPLEPPDPEETPRGQALIALREIDFDKATGKLSDSDYEELHARYSTLALAAMDRETAATSDPLEAMIAARARMATVADGPRSCLKHGVRPESETRFCSECGAGLITSDGCCVACRSAIPANAGFCPGCATRIH